MLSGYRINNLANNSARALANGLSSGLAAGLRFVRGCSSMVEPQPSKLMTAVQFRSPAPYIYGKSRPYSSVVEHFLGKEEVTGSIPVMGSINPNFQTESCHV